MPKQKPCLLGWFAWLPLLSLVGNSSAPEALRLLQLPFVWVVRKLAVDAVTSLLAATAGEGLEMQLWSLLVSFNAGTWCRPICIYALVIKKCDSNRHTARCVPAHRRLSEPLIAAPSIPQARRNSDPRADKNSRDVACTE